MNINKNNYEAFFLDYHEGNLSPLQVAELLLFIEQHPELKEEFESFDNISLENFSSEVFSNKSILKKEITLDNKEDYFIGSIENTLNEQEKTLLDTFLIQHPQFCADLKLFEKTKLATDVSIVFENKDELKHIAITADNLLIASTEGLLTKQEKAILDQQLLNDKKLQQELKLFQQTISVADASIVYENKDELKRKERKVIPLYFYVAIAASTALLFGLFFLFNTNTPEQQFAENKTPVSIQNNYVGSNSLNTNPIEQASVNKNETIASVSKKKNVNKTNQKKHSENKIDTPALIENNVVANNPQKTTTPENEQTKDQEIASTALNSAVVTKTDKANDTEKETTEFLSLKELVTAKFKTKALDEKSLAVEKKSGRVKKLNGWDVAQMAAKGISKLTGRKLEVKPKYNESGNVTAFALSAGELSITRSR